MASLGQGFQWCHQTMVSISSLEALKDTWSKKLGHPSAQLKSVQAQVSSFVLLQWELLSGTESSTEEGLRILSDKKRGGTNAIWFTEALHVALWQIPHARGEVSVKDLADMKEALEESNREQMRDMNRRLLSLRASSS